MPENKYIAEMHEDHRLWQSELLLARDQLKSFQNRLSEVNMANTSKEIKAEIEKFQNQFLCLLVIIANYTFDFLLS